MIGRFLYRNLEPRMNRPDLTIRVTQFRPPYQSALIVATQTVIKGSLNFGSKQGFDESKNEIKTPKES